MSTFILEDAMTKQNLRLTGTLLFVAACHLSLASVANADEILDCNTIAVRAMQVPPAVPGPLQQRLLAIVHVSMFDAVNGLKRQYEPIHVHDRGPRRAGPRLGRSRGAGRSGLEGR